ncbi:MAG: MerR family transcriptional regulator [Actinomycetes bacterium]|jgi:DNA-binding transcriptional MerR regulator|nr:MerR family transcriptional regulator [Actinomycetes bacterium]
MSPRDYLTIGEVVRKLQTAGYDLSVSKLRFLEDEGLVTPERTEGGYRKYSAEDGKRIELVLKLQSEKFLPLFEIKKRLERMDAGHRVAEIDEVLADARQADDALADDALDYADDCEHMALVELARTEHIPEAFVFDLKKYGVVEVTADRNGNYVDAADLSCIRAAWALRAVGVEPRHLRMYATFADKESLTYEQFLRPTYRHKTPESKKQLADCLRDINRNTDVLKRHLLRKTLSARLNDLL